MKLLPLNGYIKNSFVNFKAGHTSIYSDFDGTYMPYPHHQVCFTDTFVNDHNQRNRFSQLYSNFKKFIQSGRKDLSFILTTGRTKAEYEYIEKKILEKNLEYYKPETLITSNGNDKYIREKNTDWSFDSARNDAIRRKYNIPDRKLIVSDLKNILKSQIKDIVIIDTKVNKSEADYGKDSMEFALKGMDGNYLNHYAAFVQDEEFRFDIAFSPNIDVHKVVGAFQKYFDERGILLKVDCNPCDKHNLTPVFYSKYRYELKPAATLSIEPMADNKRLTKLYDIKNDVKKIIQKSSDDLVIAAGDGDNDLDMLNPLNYLDLYGIKNDADIRVLLQREEVRKALREMPFFAVITGKHSCMDGLRRIGRILDEHGIHKMIFTNDDRSGILDGIKRAMNEYGDTNDDYKYSMNYELFKEIIGG